MRLSHSRISTFQRCQKLYDWKYNKRLELIEVRSLAREFGLATHKGYQAIVLGKTLVEAQKAFAEEYEPVWRGEVDEDRSLVTGAILLEEFYNRFNPVEDYLRTWKPELVEVRFSLEVVPGLILRGIIDRLPKFQPALQENGEVVVEDWKTSSRPDLFVAKPNNQITGYCWAASQLSGKQVRTAYFTIIGSKIRKRPKEGQEVVTILRDQTDRSEEDFQEWMRMVVRVAEEIERCMGKGSWEKSAPEACGMYFGCDYIDLCKVGRSSQPSLINTLYQEREEVEWDEGE